MPNIVITNFCNLKCPYCFAKQHMDENDSINITIDQLKRILQWLNLHNGRIGLIGGEPLLHPCFKNILEVSLHHADKTNNTILVFTNGTLLHNYIDDILGKKRLRMLININHPDITGKYWNDLLDSLAIINCDSRSERKPFSLGVNIYPELDDYAFILDPLKLINAKCIRVSIVAPIKKEHIANKKIYYSSMKQKFLNFVTMMKKNDIMVDMDCNKIPLCYFSDAEKEFINKNTMGYEPVCDHNIDIFPDMIGIPCFGMKDRFDLSHFKDIYSAKKYMDLRIIYPKITEIGQNNSCGCNSCTNFHLVQCQGGCLAFTRLNT